MSSETSPKASGNAKRKGGNKKNSVQKSATDNEPVSLVRNPDLGMNPRAILTGYYGSRGERIRHTVHDGALRMPKEAIGLIEQATKETGAFIPTTYDLPGLDSVVRPCIDPKLETIVVTELSLEKVAVMQPIQHSNDMSGQPPKPSIVHVLRTRAQNRTMRRTTLKSEDTTERIRGGGSDSEKMDIDSTSSSSNKPAMVAAGAPKNAASAPAAPGPISSIPQAPLPATQSATPRVPTTDAASTIGKQPSNPMKPSMPFPAPVLASVTQLPSGDTLKKTAAQPPAVTAAQTSNASTVLPPQPSANAVTGSNYVVGPNLAPAAVRPSASSNLPLKASVPSKQPSLTSAYKPTVPSAVTSRAPTQTPFNQSLGNAARTPTAPMVAPSPSASVGEAGRVQPAPSTVLSTKGPFVPPARTLGKRPAPQWEQHKPGPNDEMVTPADQLSPKPDWYKKDGIADIERTMLPEWFNSSAPHRTPETYIRAREKVIAISATIANRNVTNSMIRRSIIGDAGSLQRLRSFLVDFGIINEDGINDSAPTPAILRKQKSAPKRFNDELRDELVLAVVQQSKRRKIDDTDMTDSVFIPIDWHEVALQVGHGATSADCERNFLSMPLNENNAVSTERSITPDVAQETSKGLSSLAEGLKSPESFNGVLGQEVVRGLVESAGSDVIKKVMATAMEAADNNLKQAQSAALLGLAASRALEEARNHESALSSVLSQLVNQRMEKLENRMALMDDVEGIMEAEKVALELERRDLYTTRCRHWFGGA